MCEDVSPVLCVENGGRAVARAACGGARARSGEACCEGHWKDKVAGKFHEPKGRKHVGDRCHRVSCIAYLSFLCSFFVRWYYVDLVLVLVSYLSAETYNLIIFLYLGVLLEGHPVVDLIQVFLICQLKA